MRHRLLMVVAGVVLGVLTPSLATAAPERSRPAAVVSGQLHRLHLVGAAERTDEGIMLVDSGTYQVAGAAYTKQPVSVQNFTATMTFNIQGNCSDGIALVVQAQGRNALGGPGGDIGYGDLGANTKGIMKSLAFELDTTQNRWDPPVPHLSLQSRGPKQNSPNQTYSLGSKSTTPVADGLDHTLVVSYDGTPSK